MPDSPQRAPHPSPRTRPAAGDDIPTIQDLVSELQRELEIPQRFEAAQVLSMLTSPASGVLLAEVAGNVAGLLSYSVHPGFLHGGASFRIEDLIIGSGFRRQGCARALLAAGEERARQLGCVELEVSALEGNLAAQGLYRSMGYVGGAILMEKEVPPLPSDG